MIGKRHRIGAVIAGFAAMTFIGFSDFTPVSNDVVSQNQTADIHFQNASRMNVLKPKVPSMTLALSWQPAYCEIESDKTECQTQGPDRYDSTNFSLHGLWPVGTYCTKVPYQKVPLDLWKALVAVMPGTASGLHRYQWKKHGTCYSSQTRKYYNDSVVLVLGLNATPVRELFFNRIGKYLSAAEIRATFEENFGRGVGDRVMIHCVKDGERTLIQELRINLKGEIGDTTFASLLKQARAQKQGCKGGIVDAVGLQ